MRRGILAVIAAFALLYIPTAYAQSSLAGGSALTIAVSPQSPAPGASVALTLQSPIEDLSQSSITWYQNGAIIAQGIGQTDANVTAPALGKQMRISASVQNADGTSDSAQISLIPAEVDLLVDSDSYVPPFYRGRALPSEQTNIRLQAIAHFIRPDGSAVPSSQISYTWKQDGRVVGNISGSGKSSAVLPAALLFGTTRIEVDAASGDGTISGSASISLPTNDPILVLYEDNPVYGFTYYHAIAQTGSATQIPNVEMTFAAVPYFAQAYSPNDTRLLYNWSVNGAPVAQNRSDPSEITLNATNSSGQASVALSLADSQNAFVNSNGSWAVALGSQSVSGFESSGSGPINPFTGTSK